MRVDEALDGADAVRLFAEEVGPRQPDRIQVRLDADDGMTRLCAVEAALASRWPPSTVKELIWLTRTERTDGDRLHLQAFTADGELMEAATFRLERRDA